PIPELGIGIRVQLEHARRPFQDAAILVVIFAFHQLRAGVERSLTLQVGHLRFLIGKHPDVKAIVFSGAQATVANLDQLRLEIERPKSLLGGLRWGIVAASAGHAQRDDTHDDEAETKATASFQCLSSTPSRYTTRIR